MSSQAVYKAYKGPIASVPGPWLARWTTVILKYHWIIGDRPKYVHKLHEKYGGCCPHEPVGTVLTDPMRFSLPTGPIVRVSPDEIDICDVDVVRDMAKTSSGFLKSAWYNTMAIGGYKNIFSVRDPRRAVSGVGYSQRPWQIHRCSRLSRRLTPSLSWRYRKCRRN